MCGIFGYICNNPEATGLYPTSVYKLLEHGRENYSRGPDGCTVKDIWTTDYYLCMQFYRLSIVGVENGEQPFMSGKVMCMVNGEIYNHRELAKSFELELKTQSDCEVIIKLYEKYGIEKTIDLLDGVWAFVIYDLEAGQVHFARDMWGVRPLYYATGLDLFSKNHCGNIVDVAVSSTAKGLIGTDYKWVEPRKIYTLTRNSDGFFDLSIKNYVDVSYRGITSRDIADSMGFSAQYQGMMYDGCIIEPLFTSAVEKRISSCERSIGYYLSGGLDSSLVLATAMKIIHAEGVGTFKTPIDVFSIGTEGCSPDVNAACLLVDWLKKKYGENSINHHIVNFEYWDRDMLTTLIYEIESSDVTTVRASMPMYLLSRYVTENTDIKVIMSGEGSDELFGGYLYFRNAPNPVEFEKESRRLLEDLYKFDVLRCDRSVSCCGLEVRVPFLDRDFSSYVMDIDTSLKMPFNENSEKNNHIEKYLLRKSFVGELPPDILWRVKDGMSDGVGKGFQKWVQGLAQIEYPDEKTAVTAERRLYRDILKNGTEWEMKDLIEYQWMPKWVTGDALEDPSGSILM